MAKPSKPGNVELHDELAEQLASSTLVERFSVDSDKGWEISFDKLSGSEFGRLVDIAMRYLANTKVVFGDNSEDGHRAIRWQNLTDGQAREFTRAVAAAFQGCTGNKTDLQLGDIVEEIATNRRGTVNVININVGQAPYWRVQFSDGQKPPLRIFKDVSELRLITRPRTESGPGFVPGRGIMG